MMCASASITASVGVPVTEKRRSSWRRSRTGSVRVSEWPAPDCSSVGATIQMSSLNVRATDSSRLKPAGVHAVVVGDQDPHRAAPMRERRSMLQPRTARQKMRHIRNSLAISSRRTRRFLLSVGRAIIGRVGDCRPVRISRGKVSTNCLRLHRWPGRSQAAAFGLSRGGSGNPVRGRDIWRLLLVDLYGGDDFEPFDRIILSEGYRPSEDEEFMCGKHRAYFLRKLKAWKEAIIEESRATMAQLQVDSLREPDLADRASSETDWGDRASHPRPAAQAHRQDRLRDAPPVRGRIWLLRSDRRADLARPPRSPPDRDHDARSPGAPRAHRARFPRRLR